MSQDVTNPKEAFQFSSTCKKARFLPTFLSWTFSCISQLLRLGQAGLLPPSTEAGNARLCSFSSLTLGFYLSLDPTWYPTCHPQALWPQPQLSPASPGWSGQVLEQQPIWCPQECTAPGEPAWKAPLVGGKPLWGWREKPCLHSQEWCKPGQDEPSAQSASGMEACCSLVLAGLGLSAPSSAVSIATAEPWSCHAALAIGPKAGSMCCLSQGPRGRPVGVCAG